VTEGPIPTYQAGKADLSRARLYRYDGSHIDIHEQLLEFRIEENPNNVWLAGEVLMSDSAGLINTFPIVGDELIEIWWKTPGEDYSTNKVFLRVWDVGQRERYQDRAEGYILRCISPCSLRNQEGDVMGSFTGTPSEIAEKVYENYLRMPSEFDHVNKPLITWPCDNTVHYASTKWRPLEFIQKLANQAESTDINAETGDTTDYCDYVFFERLDAFYFYPWSAFKQGFGGIGDSIFIGTANKEGTDVYKDPYLEVQEKAKMKVKKFENELRHGKLKGLADQLEKKVTGKGGIADIFKDLLNGVHSSGQRASGLGEPDRKSRIAKSTLTDEFKWVRQGDLHERMEEGMFRNSNQVVDTIIKSYQQFDWNYSTDFRKIPHCGAKSEKVISPASNFEQLSGSPVAKLMVGFLRAIPGGNAGTADYRTTSSAPYLNRIKPENDPQLYNANTNTVKEVIRVAAQAMFDFYTIELNVPGDSRMKTGMLVDFYPQIASGIEEDAAKYDQNLCNDEDAAFVVYGVTHDYTAEESKYNTGLTLVKDCSATKVDRDAIDQSVRVLQKGIEDTLSGKIIPAGGAFGGALTTALGGKPEAAARQFAGLAKSLGMTIDPNASFKPNKGIEYTYPDDDFE
jgi:hypothetical protein